jgi:hypothetical protein
MPNVIAGSLEGTAHEVIVIPTVLVEIIQAATITILIGSVMLTDLPNSTEVTIITPSSTEEEMIPV